MRARSIYVALMGGLLLAAVFRPLNLFPDSSTYIEYLSRCDSCLSVEPTFVLIRNLCSIVSEDYLFLFFSVYAVLAVVPKFVAIPRLSVSPLVSAMAYISMYALVFEFVQIRAAVSVGLFLFAIPDLVRRSTYSYFFKIMLAISFHYSAAIYLPFYFLSALAFRRLYYLAPILGLLGSYLFYMLYLWGLPYVEFVLPEYFSVKYIAYYNRAVDNPFHVKMLLSPYIISMLVVYYISLFCLCDIRDELLDRFIQLLSAGIFLYYLFIFMPDLAYRFSKMLSVVVVFIIPYIVRECKPSWVANLCFLLVFILGFLYSIYSVVGFGGIL